MSFSQKPQLVQKCVILRRVQNYSFESFHQGFTKRYLSWLTNSALVYEPKCGERGGISGGVNQWDSCAHFWDLTPYLTYGSTLKPHKFPGQSYEALYKSFLCVCACLHCCVFTSVVVILCCKVVCWLMFWEARGEPCDRRPVSHGCQLSRGGIWLIQPRTITRTHLWFIFL